MNRVTVLEETLEEREPEELWARWGWKLLHQTPECTVLEGFYSTLGRQIPGRIEVFPSVDRAQQLRFYYRDGNQEEFCPACMQATSVEQGILTLQAVFMHC